MTKKSARKESVEEVINTDDYPNIDEEGEYDDEEGEDMAGFFEDEAIEDDDEEEGEEESEEIDADEALFADMDEEGE
jgi:hypothetical protein